MSRVQISPCPLIINDPDLRDLGPITIIVDFATVSIGSLPHGLYFLYGFHVLLAAVEGLRSLGEGVPHEDGYHLDVDVLIQVSLTEGASALTEIEFHSDLLLHIDLHVADTVAGKVFSPVGHML